MQRLFTEEIDVNKNWLPYDGTVNYLGCILSHEQANFYEIELMHNIEWRNDESLIYGKLITTKRKVAWYADEPFDYTYSNITKQALLWTPVLLSLKKVVEEYAEEKFNSCLLNLYHTGDEGMSWHSDGEKMLKKNGAIASMSLGAERKFSFKHKKDQTKIDMLLQHGSLMIMKGETQTHWLHRLPPTRKIKSPRVNLTFRNIVDKNS